MTAAERSEDDLAALLGELERRWVAQGAAVADDVARSASAAADMFWSAVFVAAWLELIDTGAVAWSADTRGWTIDRGRVPRWLALV